MNKIGLTMNTLFAGVGCQEYGIKKTGLFDLDVKAIQEIDKDATVVYAVVHCGLTKNLIEQYQYPSLEEMQNFLQKINLGYVPEKNKPYDWHKKNFDFVKKYWLACKLSNNLGDINQIDSLPYADLWQISAPCTDIQVSGKMMGLNPDDNTRSQLIWQNIRLLKTAQDTNTLPKFLFLENVKNLVGKRFLPDFQIFNSLIGDFGYNTYWDIINAKNCGVPQNRERVFSIYIRKDIDNGKFTFPIPFDTGIRLKDILDKNVSESYYMNTDGAKKLIQNLVNNGTLGDANYE